MKWIVFFDGTCGLCSRSVRFLARMDRRERLLFAPLQGETAARLQLAEHASLDNGTMVIRRESDGRIFTHSDGVLEVCRALGGIWHVAVILRAIPSFLRDALYRLIARNRIRWFGHADACSLPSSSLLTRLLQ